MILLEQLILILHITSRVIDCSAVGVIIMCICFVFLLLKDLKVIVQKVATFLGYAYSDDVINRIVDHCSFASMKKNPMTNPDYVMSFFIEQQSNKPETSPEGNKQEKTSFMRKGWSKISLSFYES